MTRKTGIICVIAGGREEANSKHQDQFDQLLTIKLEQVFLHWIRNEYKLREVIYSKDNLSIYSITYKLL